MKKLEMALLAICTVGRGFMEEEGFSLDLGGLGDLRCIHFLLLHNRLALI